MNTIYQSLVFIHIVSAILGMGPGFILPVVAKSAKNMDQLRNAYVIKHRLHVFVMIGGTLLLVTGLLMGAIHPIWFRTGWYVTSLILFLIGLASGPLLLSPLTKPIKQLLATYQGEEIPEEYYRLAKRLDFYEYLGSGIFFLVIILMILKPF